MSIKIKGPSGGPPPVGPTSSAPPAGPAAAPDETAAVAASPADLVSQVAGGLRAGTLTVEAAVNLLIEDTVRRQAGAGGPRLAAELLDVLRETAVSDPFLAAKIRRLTAAK